MHLHQQRVLQSLRRVQGWCAANPGLVPAPVGQPEAWSPLTRQLDTLNTCVTQVMDSAAQQGAHAELVTLDGTGELPRRAHLRAEMHVITQVSQALRKVVPGIGSLKMPSSKTQVEGLLKAADALHMLASTYETVLVEHGLAPDFLAQLRDAISSLRASVDGRGAARTAQVKATQQLAVGLGLGTQYVQIMDAALTKALQADTATLAGWRNAKRITTKGVLTSGITTLVARSSTSTGATPMLVTQTAASTPLTSAPAPVPAGSPEADARVA